MYDIKEVYYIPSEKMAVVFCKEPETDTCGSYEIFEHEKMDTDTFQFMSTAKYQYRHGAIKWTRS